MGGRFHFYEGYSAEEVVFPIRVLGLLGIKTLLLSNAGGGVNPSFNVGDIMIIKDHIGIDMRNPLIGKNIDELGPRFPDMSEPYKKELIEKAKMVAANLQIEVREGVYFCVTGPTYETPAEYKMIHIIGGDAGWHEYGAGIYCCQSHGYPGFCNECDHRPGYQGRSYKDHS
jgi:purine-nucleoside phosphorylase